MFSIDSVLIGPFRILLLFAGTLFVHQLVTRQPIKIYGLDYVLKRVIVYGSALLLVVFLLIQLDMYDIFSILTVFIVFLGFLYLDLGTNGDSTKQFNKKRKSCLLRFFMFMERNPSSQGKIKKYLRLFHFKKINFVFLMAFLLSLTVFVSRYLFLKNDLYTLSSLWMKNLEIIKAFDENIWFLNNDHLLGELALINFYAKISGISKEMAIHSFGLLENFGLAIMLYWVILKITRSKFMAPIFGVICFAFFYRYLPINIFLEHNSLYLALFFAIPAMMFTVLPELLFVSKKKYFLVMSIIYCAIGFINFFVAFIILPLFLLNALVFHIKGNRPFVVRSLFAFTLGMVTTITIHSFGCYLNKTPFWGFVRANLMVVDTYAYFPQLILPPGQMVAVYTYLGVITLLLILPLFFRNRKKWMPSFVFLLFLNGFVQLERLQIAWIDTDLYFHSLTPLVVIMIGIMMGIIVQYAQVTVPKKPRIRAVTLSLVFLSFVAFAYVTNGFFSYNHQEIDELKTDLLDVYHELSSNHFPYSYAVVNQKYGFSLSLNEHHFINYSDFLDKYPKRDSVYQIYREDEKFLQENPDYILPHSVFVILTKPRTGAETNNLATPSDVSLKILKQLDILRQRGRKITVFRQDGSLTVYEIVNRNKSSKLNDLIFNL